VTLDAFHEQVGMDDDETSIHDLIGEFIGLVHPVIAISSAFTRGADGFGLGRGAFSAAADDLGDVARLDLQKGKVDPQAAAPVAFYCEMIAVRIGRGLVPLYYSHDC
jgi:hypothetical protein